MHATTAKITYVGRQYAITIKQTMNAFNPYRQLFLQLSPGDFTTLEKLFLAKEKDIQFRIQQQIFQVHIFGVLYINDRMFFQQISSIDPT